MIFNGEMLRRLREDRGLTQNELARELGLPSGTWISSWEIGRVKSLDGLNLARLCQFFGNEAKDWWKKEGGENGKQQE